VSGSCRSGTAPGLVLARREAKYQPELGSAGSARRLLREALAEADRLPWADAGALALSEVVANAALHAHTTFVVVIEVRSAQLLVEVRDGSAAPPRPRRYDAQATTGRGMGLVAAVTTACGVRSLRGRGKVVWFTVEDDPGAGRPAAEDEPSAEDILAAWDVEGDWAQLLGQDASPVPAVTLMAMPPALWLAARQHHDAIVRELVLYLAEHDDVVVDIPLADQARSLVSEALLDVLAERGSEPAGSEPGAAELAAGEPALPESLTLVLAVPREMAPAYPALQAALDAAERLALDGRLLASPGLPEIIAVRNWVCQQILVQLAGGERTPWQGADQPHFETSVNTSARRDPARTGWDDSAVRDDERAVVAADEANRILAASRPLAALVGWEVEELVGRRLVTLVPPRLRDAHVAGFTRYLATGEAHILGVPLVLPVLHADGRELTCRVLIERAPSVVGAPPVYLAWIEAAPEGPG